MKWLWKLTGGRPMRLHSPAFIDAVSGYKVGHYMDKHGKWWLADNRWSWFRVPMRGSEIMDALQHKPSIGSFAKAKVEYWDGSSRVEYVSFDEKYFAGALAALDADVRKVLSLPPNEH